VVSISPGAFRLNRIGLYNGDPGDQASVGTIDFTTNVVAGKTVATLSFHGAKTESGSLADGLWQLRVDSTRVNSSGIPMATDNSQHVVHRLFGDMNADQIVNNDDYDLFGTTFGLTTDDPGFQSSLDWNDDDAINNDDFEQFSTRFGVQL
ncbi:MAG: hypothetical protein ACRCZF_00785, partial [Gemmataceae bacterium]